MDTYKIFNGDCLEVLPTITDNINLVLVDLPYGQTDCEWDIKINLKDMWDCLEKICDIRCTYVFFCTTRFGYELINSRPTWFKYDLVWEKSKAMGFLNANKLPLRAHEMVYIFGNSSSNDREREHNTELREYSKKVKEYINVPLSEINELLGNYGFSHFWGYQAQQFSLPTKENYEKVVEKYKLYDMDGFLSYKQLKGKYKPVGRTGMVYNAQMVEGGKPYKGHAGTIPEGSVYGAKKKISTGSADGKRYPRSVLHFNSVNGNTIHPTQKPVDLCEWLIKTYSNEGDTVLDFTMGSGTTGEAAINTGRRFIGIEMDKEIYKVAKKRLRNLARNSEA